jgi:transketolase
VRQACQAMIHELAREDERIMFVGSDLGVGVLDDFKRELPNQFLMEGVAEASIVGLSAGLALEGAIPYVNTIATFNTRRCYEQIAIDVCLHNLNVRIIGQGAGFVYAPLGPTHQAIEDIAIMRALPNMTVVAPADADEMKRLMPQTVDWPGPVYIRVAKGYDPIVSKEEHGFRIGEPITMRHGTDALIITTGITLQIGLEAADKLEDMGVSSRVMHVHTIKPLAGEEIAQAISESRCVVTVEEHSILGGLGGAVAETTVEAGLDRIPPFKRIGIPDVFAHEYGSQASIMESMGISTEGVTTTVKNLLGG